jgi:quinol monooxygenase YgiN
MIIRVFRARVHAGKAEEFRQFFLEKALPLVRAQPGLARADIGWPIAPTTDEFLMITVWRDLEAVKNVAGDNWQTARILPEERPLLREVEVEHYEMAQFDSEQ